VTRDEIVLLIEDMGYGDEDIILFDGMEDAFLGIAERFEPVSVIRIGGKDDGIISERDEGGVHRYFAVYSYAKMVKILTGDGMDDTDAVEYLEFNTVGLYAGPSTPAIMRDYGLDFDEE